MRQLRTTFCLFSGVVAFLVLAQHLGMNLWSCASCSFVNQLPISAFIAWAGPVVLTVLTFGAYHDKRWANIGILLTVPVSLSLIVWMVTNSSICLLCMLVHSGVLAAALCLLPKVKVVGPLFFSLAIAFTTTGGWDRFLASSDVGVFRIRDREHIPEGKVYVLFTDPECSRCQAVEKQISKMSSPPNILHRWSLLPQNLYRSIRTATILEMARIQGEAEFDRLHSEILNSPPPYDDEAILSAASKAGLGGQASKWLEHPSERALIAIEDDQTTSQELKIRSLPALAELSQPDVTGMRTMRLVPFSSIGLSP